MRQAFANALRKLADWIDGKGGGGGPLEPL